MKIVTRYFHYSDASKLPKKLSDKLQQSDPPKEPDGDSSKERKKKWKWKDKEKEKEKYDIESQSTTTTYVV